VLLEVDRGLAAASVARARNCERADSNLDAAPRDPQAIATNDPNEWMNDSPSSREYASRSPE